MAEEESLEYLKALEAYVVSLEACVVLLKKMVENLERQHELDKVDAEILEKFKRLTVEQGDFIERVEEASPDIIVALTGKLEGELIKIDRLRGKGNGDERGD